MAEGSAERVRVLVAEDDEDIRHLVERLLTFAHVEVRTVDNGADAVTSVMSDPVHCVVLDFKMPGLDGMEVLRALAARVPRTPVVMLTASIEEQVERQAKELGASTMLRKPFEARELLAAVGRAVREGDPAIPLPPALAAHD